MARATTPAAASSAATSEDGTGLGLAIVRDIAEAHGWRVSLGESGGGGVRVEVSGVAAAEEPAPTVD